MIVHAFDRTKTVACGEINLKVLNEPCKFAGSFVVVDILPPSTYSLVDHGLISRKRLISVMAEEDLITLASIMVPFVASQQVDHASRYHSSEFV